MSHSATFSTLPGGDLIEKGLQDLACGKESIESLLVQIGTPRLRALNIEIPPNGCEDPDERLYDLLSERHGKEAHSKYNSLLRQLSSFARALEHRVFARQRQQMSEQK
jgi:hypothetical protein